MKRIISTLFCLTGITIISFTHSDASLDPSTIVAIWLLDEDQGNTIKDLSANGNDGTINGADWTEGKRGTGLEFDGSSHVEIPPSKSLDDYLDGFTYLLWVKPTAPPPNANTRLIEKDWHNPTIQIGPNDFYGSIAVNADQASTNVRGGTWEQDEWSYVALTHDGNVLTLYVDGELVADKEVGKPDEKLDTEIRFGAWRARNWDFIGVLDEVAVFNVPLSEKDINTIYEDGLEAASDVTALGRLTTTWGTIKNFR